jgi:hypothetical protein
MLTIASPNTDRSLLTLAELRGAAGVTDGSKDASLTTLGGYVAAVITKACRVAVAGALPPTLRLETVSETIRRHHHRHHGHGSPGHALILARRPVVDITAVTENDTLLTADQYEVEAAAGLLYRLSGSCRIAWCAGTIVAEYSAGYDTVPDDLKYAAIKFVQLVSQQAGRDPLLRRDVVPGVSEMEWWVEPSREIGTPPEVLDLLSRGGFIETFVG